MKSKIVLSCIILSLFYISCEKNNDKIVKPIDKSEANQLINEEPVNNLPLSNYQTDYKKLAWGYAKSDFNQALDYGNNFLEYARKIGNKKMEGDALHVIGVIYFYHNDYPSSLDFFLKSLEIKKDLIEEVAKLKWNIGLIYHKTNFRELALQYYLESLKYWESIDNKTEIADLSKNIGSLYQETKNYAQALFYFTKVFQAREKLGNLSLVSDSYLDLGNVYNLKKDFSEAEHYYKKALELSIVGNNNQLTAWIYRSLGLNEYDQKHFTKALEYSHKALALEESRHDTGEMLKTLYNIGLCEKESGNLAQSILTFKRMEQLAKETTNQDQLAFAEEQLAKVYNLQGNYKESSHYFEMHGQLKTELEARYQALAKQNEKTQINISSITFQRNHEQELMNQLAIQRAITYIAIGLIIAAILFFFLYLYQQRRRKASDAKINNALNTLEGILKDNEEWKKAYKQTYQKE